MKNKMVSVYWEISFVEENGKVKMHETSKEGMNGCVYYYSVGETIKFSPDHSVIMVAEILEGYEAAKKATDVKRCKTVLGILDKIRRATKWVDAATAVNNATDVGLAKEALEEAILEVLCGIEDAKLKLQEFASPTEEEPPVEEVPPTEEQPPVEEVPPTEEQPPVEEVPPTEEQPPVEEVPPTEEQPPVEEVFPAGETAHTEAFMLNVLNSFLKHLVKVDDEWYVRISDTKLISLAAVTREDGKAIAGEEPLARRSPDDFVKIAKVASAAIPTTDDFGRFEEIFKDVEVIKELVNLLNEIFGNGWTTNGFTTLQNQLVVTEEGTYKTYQEGKALLPAFRVYNLSTHKVIEG